MREARRVWGVRPTKLPDVCRYLGLSLTHHDALSDAEAAAQIVIAARSGEVNIRNETAGPIRSLTEGRQDIARHRVDEFATDLGPSPELPAPSYVDRHPGRIGRRIAGPHE